MQRIFTVIRRELVANFKRRSYLVMTFGLSVLAIVIVVGVMVFQGDDRDSTPSLFEQEENAKPTGYIDESGLFPFPGQFAGQLIAFESQEAAREAVLSGELVAYYVIPADYMESGEITRHSVQFNLLASDTGLIESFLVTSMLANDSPLLLARLQSPATVLEHQLDKSGETVTEIEGDNFSKFGLVYGFALIMLFSTFFNANYLMRSVIEEKENRMIEIVLSSLRPAQILIGKLIGQGAAGLLQILVWLGTIGLLVQITDAQIPFIGAVDLPASTFAVALLYFLGGYMLFGAFASGIGAVSTNMREGPQYSVVYTLPAVVPLMFMSQLMAAPNGPLAVGLSLFPMTAPLGMIERLAVGAVPGWQIALSLVLLYASVGGALWLAGRVFRVNTLLSGQLPTRKELVNLLLHG